MRQFKKVAALAMVATMAASSFVACGESTSSTAAPTKAPDKTTAPSTTAPKTEAQKTDAPAPEIKDTGKVLNIYLWNDEFANRLADHYEGYVKNDEENVLAGGKIGDVEVKFVQVPSDGGAYQNNLDLTLLDQETAGADDKIDIFLVEADYALKYVKSNYTMDIKDLGITADDIKDQYKYTQDVMTYNGAIKGLSWQACPGAVFYNRNVAKEVLGADDSETVQEAIKDWDAYKATAKKLADAKKFITPSVNDTYRVYSNNVSTPWVVDKKINIDANIKAWVDASKEIYDMGATSNDDLWAGYDRAKNTNDVFCTFGPAWLINFCFGYDAKGMADGTADMTNIANAGQWGIAEGPQSFFWGGTWICAATGTDNAGLIKDIMIKLTCTPDVMKGIVEKDDDFVNNKPAMDEMAKGDYTSYILGGVNPLPIYCAGVEKVDLSNLSIYDQNCNEQFQAAMKAYFAGTSSYDECLEAFNKAIVDIYPTLG